MITLEIIAHLVLSGLFMLLLLGVVTNKVPLDTAKSTRDKVFITILCFLIFFGDANKAVDLFLQLAERGYADSSFEFTSMSSACIALIALAGSKFIHILIQAKRDKEKCSTPSI